ncbi:MAG: excinuclease ABC subunit UvrC [Candidatus Doudnabacteria bacterium]|nr:excinuclease ABC subunit UvrC [Candidatus Doudnabacteria bacterium]
MPMNPLREKLKDVPKSPGVYQFLDKDGKVLYVGKAKNLRSRVGQYFSGHDERPQIPHLMKEAADFSYTVVNNELESLFLENTVIKQYLPKYNILLRDDKNYAFIKIDYSTEIPQIGYSRRVEGTGYRVQKSPLTPHPSPLPPKYFGPYTAAYKIRNTLHLMRKIFPYCSAEKVSGKPCFHYHLHRCPGVCIGKISLDDYRLYLKKIEDFLAGNTGKISRQLQSEMKLAAAHKLFEKAARLRDQLNSIKLLDERQTVILAKKVDWDIVSLASSDGYTCVNLFKVRGGKLQDKENFVYEISNAELRNLSGTTENYGTEIVQKFLEQYYAETSSVPKIIYTQYAAADANLIIKLVKSRIGRGITIISPQKGKARELTNLGSVNAREYLSKWLSDQAGHLDKINKALERLRDTVKLADIPRRIECYDISNIQGTNPVGSMVVFTNGLPAKSQYRKFKIRGKSTPDDFAMMKEMLSRRLARSLPSWQGGVSPSGNGVVGESIDKTPNPPPLDNARGTLPLQEERLRGWPLPDLIVIDGGKGQLSAALETIHNSQLSINVIGLAKRIEEIFLPDKPEPIILSHDDPALQMLQRLRDEAHRFGITFHRDLRSKQAVKSALDEIPGIGPKTKKILKAKFGTVAVIRQASLEELTAAVGKAAAERIKKYL